MGTLAVMVSGRAPVIDQVRSVLECFGKNVFTVGTTVGQGQVAKIVNNLLSATAIVVTSEAVALGLRAGIDATTMIAILNAGSGRNSATEDKFPRAVLSGTMNIDFQLRLMAKDVRLCLDEAHRLHAPMFVGGVVEQLWSLADYRSAQDADSMEMVRMISTWMGVDIAEARI
jgi:3-hydroxyisobutyrate dehydrogenase-like beta-hydroxyacid dehydrogenase